MDNLLGGVTLEGNKIYRAYDLYRDVVPHVFFWDIVELKVNMMRILILLTALPFACLSQENNSNNDSISGRPEKFLVVEKTAEYPGGMSKFYNYVMKNFNYPEVAKKNGVEGKVYIEFVINQDGSIDDKSVRALTPDELSKFATSTNLIFDPDCQGEAIRLLKGCPDWKPATIKNKAVRQRMILPISFKI